MNFLSASLRLCGLILLAVTALAAQIPAPKDTLGFTPGDDRKLASWATIIDYFKKLDAASDRVMFEEVGKSTMGAPFVYATISSPENLKNLERYKEINALLADPRKMTGALPLVVTDKKNNSQKKTVRLPGDVSAQLIRDGKTIVLITCGIHSTEVGSTLSSTLIAHRLASSNEPDVKKILDNTIILLVPSLNPDGVDIVKNWYDKTLGTPYEGTDPPELYHKYVGHDNNRDWYAFTQVETQLTVDKIHNVWHPQIVHDIHQQGQNGARLFLPPYMQPVEPNVPKQIVEGYTELGNYMATTLRAKGLQGITTNTTYDAWTPARAYSHYHGGVRILSETASAKLATPINVKFENLRKDGVGGLNAQVESPNFGPVWKGGEWKLRDITDYMTTAAFTLLDHAADNRERWLSRFYEIGKEAVRPRKGGELLAFAFPAQQTDDGELRRMSLIGILARGGVTGGFVDQKNIKSSAFATYLKQAIPGLQKKKEISELAYVIPLDQPYGAFAKALLETQSYPNLKDDRDIPIPPYDVTAHTLPLLFNVEVVPLYEEVTFRMPKLPGPNNNRSGCPCGPTAARLPDVSLYRSFPPSMDEGWTSWIFEKVNTPAAPFCCKRFESNWNGAIRHEQVDGKAILFADQSPNQILNGYAKGSMPDEYTGGVGKEGVENLRKFVENGGTLIFLNRSSNFAIEQFNLPVKDVTRGVARKDFFIPGSILRTELDTTHSIAKGMPQQSIAWFENSPAFEIVRQETGDTRQETDPSVTTSPVPSLSSPVSAVRIIATYPKDPKQILLSGWALGAERIAGKAALVEFTVGKGKIILFGFRPQYRGQSLATFPLLFNAIAR